MAKVQSQVVGGDIKQKEADTVADLRAQLGLTNYQATVNGDPQEDNYELSDYEFVLWTQKVKGAKVILRKALSNLK